MDESSGPVLTETKKTVLKGDYTSGTRQAEDDHKTAIRENLVGALSDLQFLFNHLENDELRKVVGGDSEQNEGPIPLDDREAVWQELGFFQDPDAKDSEGRVWDPEQNPDAKTDTERYFEEYKQQGKADRQAQECLIDSVALLCRAAEMGVLDVHDLIERGVERYYRGHPRKDSHIINLKYWNEEKDAGKIKADFQEGPVTYETPRQMGDGRERHLAREGYDINPGDDENDIYPDKVTVKDDMIFYGDAPIEINDGDREAVIRVLIEHPGVKRAVDGFGSDNENTDKPTPAATFTDWLHTLHETDIEPLADEAGVSVATFRRVLSQYDSDIKAALAEGYDEIEHFINSPAGWLDDTDDE